MIDNLYREEILEHWQNPQNWGEMKSADLVVDQINPLCGDKITFYFKLAHPRGEVKVPSWKHPGGEVSARIADVSFTGNGCAISIASASILSENIKNRSLREITKLKGEDVLEMIGGTVAPARLKCAFLGLEAVRQLADKSEIRNPKF